MLRSTQSPRPAGKTTFHSLRSRPGISVPGHLNHGPAETAQNKPREDPLRRIRDQDR